MSRRIAAIFLFSVLLFAVGCGTNKKVNNPLADVGSKQPDKILFDRALDAMKHNRFDVARLSLQTLINTYPDSEYIARAKLAVADSWYAEGGSTSLAQAEIEYKDFETFFPNMPEAAEAQLKIANIHYQEMQKPDRDYTHAMRAEEEYRQLILQYPDSKLLPEAKQRLRQVQELIAEREFDVGHFYFMRQSYPASIARMRSLVDKYPLYSKADEALYMLGQGYEHEVTLLRSRPNCTPTGPPGCMNEVVKARMIAEFTKGATDAYSRILTRYPVMDRADDAKARLLALHQPVPKPTKAEVAQNKAELSGRKEESKLAKVLKTFDRHPNLTQAAKTGEPTLVDPPSMSASEVVQEATRAAMATGTVSDSHTASVETVGTGAPASNEPAPRSDAPPAVTDGSVATDASAPPAAVSSDPNELKPNVNAPADPNELKPNVPADGAQPLPPPQQVNEIQPGANPSAPGQAAANSSANSDSASSSSDAQNDDDANAASSKKKKKKGLHKLVPF